MHSTTIAAAPVTVMQAIREVTPPEVPLLVALMALRAGPRMRRLARRGSILAEFERTGFVVLRAAPHELVYGAVGRFWRASGGLRAIEPAAFPDFAEPGYAKVAFDFELEPRDGGTVLTTETRVLGTDERARRRFRRYWRVIHPGSAAIRIAWLRGIRRRAERSQLAGSPSTS